ncbi:hypothetical protein JMJ35_005074 [Cladonia borealis]|uniref:Acyl carrier protein n=1 Tax=Cladonia borealis TaxID=184061 RepID=A0AA39V2A1_9LECA|nr:hypothetical protein JMJ35_005074 [Cladonia borealis]
MLRLSLLHSALVKLPAPALRQGWPHPLVAPKVLPISYVLNHGAMRSFPATNARMSAIEERVKKIIGEQLGVKQEEVINTVSFVEDPCADSLDTMELVMALEEEFDTEILDEEAEKITIVQAAIDYINGHQS